MATKSIAQRLAEVFTPETRQFKGFGARGGFTPAEIAQQAIGGRARRSVDPKLKARAEEAGLGFAFDESSEEFKQAVAQLEGLGVAPALRHRQNIVVASRTPEMNRELGVPAATGGEFSREQIARVGLSLGFGGGIGQKKSAFDALTGEGGAPGQGSNIRAAAARQDAAAKAIKEGAPMETIVAGRKEALLARRGAARGLLALGRGRARLSAGQAGRGLSAARDLLTPVAF